MNFLRKTLVLIKGGREEIMVALDMMDESELTVYKTGPAEMIPPADREWTMPSGLIPERPRIGLVLKPFEEDNKMHQRWLRRVMEDSTCGRDTQSIMDRMTEVGLEMSRPQAFGALTQWVQSMDFGYGTEV